MLQLECTHVAMSRGSKSSEDGCFDPQKTPLLVAVHSQQDFMALGSRFAMPCNVKFNELL